VLLVSAAMGENYSGLIDLVGRLQVFKQWASHHDLCCLHACDCRDFAQFLVAGHMQRGTCLTDELEFTAEPLAPGKTMIGFVRELSWSECEVVHYAIYLYSRTKELCNGGGNDTWLLHKFGTGGDIRIDTVADLQNKYPDTRLLKMKARRVCGRPALRSHVDSLDNC